jgi:glyoxylase-like metal-dependent hydrolase (beta-lactamase superfamily II)
MRQVADNVFAIGTRGHNFYLIREGDEGTLVDAGCSKEWPKLMRALSAAGVALESVRGVVATHAHSDHFGLAGRAQDEGIRVRVHAEEETRALGTYEGRFSATAEDMSFFNIHALRSMLPMVRAGVMNPTFVDTVDTFVDGERLDLPGQPVAVHTPGHTEGHTMFHCPDLGVLFTGDGLVTMDLTGPATGPQPIGDVFNLDNDQAIESLSRITHLEAEKILPGHGRPWSGSPAEAVTRALDAAV